MNVFCQLKKPDDFILSEDGNIRLDAIAMRLQAMGENIKRLFKNHPNLSSNTADLNWDDIIRFRDFVSHHYELLDFEIVYNICTVHLPLLNVVLEKEFKK